MAQKRSPRSSPAFTLLEILVSVGVVAVLIAILMPMLSGAQTSALSLKATANIRQLGILLTQYSATNNDRPPVFFQPTLPRPGHPDQEFMYGEILVRGSWWSNSDRFHLAFDPPAPAEVLLAPKSPVPPLAAYNGGHSSPYSDYRLAKCFFGDPAYWRPSTRRGPDQWASQRFSDVTFPSLKGMMWQMTIWHIPSLGPKYPGCCADKSVSTAVLWSDLSANQEKMGLLRPGTANPYDPAYGAPMPPWAPGIPIDETVDGIRGRDR